MRQKKGAGGFDNPSEGKGSVVTKIFLRVLTHINISQ